MNSSACVILNYEKFEDTIKCVRNIYTLGATLDVIVVDNASRNESCDVIERTFKGFPNFYFIRNSENKGYSAGNNLGFKFIIKKLPHIKYAFVMNPDTLFSQKKIITEIESYFELHEECAVCAPVMKLRGEKNLQKTAWKIPSGLRLCLLQFMFYNIRENYAHVEPENDVISVDAVSGSFFAITIDALKKINLLDENIFMYCEETNLGIQLKKLGLKETLITSIDFEHNHPLSSKSRKVSLRSRLTKELKGDMKSRIYVCRKYYPIFYLPIIFLTTFFNILYLCFIHCGFKVKQILSKRK